MQRFLLLLQLLFPQELCELRSRIVDATFRLLLALPSPCTLALARFDRLRRVPITNALVAAVKQLVVGNIVGLDIISHLVKTPIRKRVHFDETGFVDLDNVNVSALTSLASSPASQDSANSQLSVCSLCGFYLCKPVIQLIICFPQALSVLPSKFFCTICASRLVYVQVDERKSSSYAVDETQGLWEVVQGVEKEKIDHLRSWDLHFGEHFEGGQAGEAKGGFLEEGGQGCNTPV